MSNRSDFREFISAQNSGPAPVRVAFFLGAGASVEAGVPDTAHLIKEFVASVASRDPEKPFAVSAFLKNLTTWAESHTPSRPVDIELVMEALQRRVDWDRDPLAALGGGTFSLPGDQARSLLKELRDFIRHRMIVQPGRIGYLAPLRGFVGEFRPLNIYSANYDTAIELFCAEHQLRYRDGFDEGWNPEVFKETGLDVRLFKIHGSVTWYFTERGRFVKVPILLESSRVELITKEQADLLALYPAQKFEYVEPLFELMGEMKRGLAQCDILFVVGYSFRDDHVRRLLWDIARSRRDFQMVLIDPRAAEIYRDRLSTYDDGKTPSSLMNRVLCLPFQFGLAFPILQPEVLPHLTELRTRWNEQMDAEHRGQMTRFESCLKPASIGGDYRRVYAALEKMGKDPMLGPGDLLEACIRSLWYALINDDESYVTYFWGKTSVALVDLVKGFNIYVEMTEHRHGFNVRSSSGQDPQQLRHLLAPLRGVLTKRQAWITADARVQPVDDLLRDIDQYLDCYGASGFVPFEEYLKTREKLLEPGLAEIIKVLSTHTGTMWDGIDYRDRVQTVIKEVEGCVVQELVERCRPADNQG
ncbi:MAG: SIR2 family protein [Acidiferrobacteraceae bacterium]